MLRRGKPGSGKVREEDRQRLIRLEAEDQRLGRSHCTSQGDHRQQPLRTGSVGQWRRVRDKSARCPRGP